MTFPIMPETADSGSPAATDIFTVPEPAPAVVAPAAPAPATAETFTHYVHLADGRVLHADLSQLTEHYGERYYENRGTASEKSTVIIGVYPR